MRQKPGPIPWAFPRCLAGYQDYSNRQSVRGILT